MTELAGTLLRMPRIKPIRVALTAVVFVVLLALAGFIGYVLRPASASGHQPSAPASRPVPKSQGDVIACNVPAGSCTTATWSYTP